MELGLRSLGEVGFCLPFEVAFFLFFVFTVFGTCTFISTSSIKKLVTRVLSSKVKTTFEHNRAI
jgi:hypothetical protein